MHIKHKPKQSEETSLVTVVIMSVGSISSSVCSYFAPAHIHWVGIVMTSLGENSYDVPVSV